MRNPILNWILVLLTGGIYSWIWTLRISSDANRIAGTRQISIARNSLLIGCLGAAYLAIFLYGWIKTNMAVNAMKAGEPGPAAQSLFLFLILGGVLGVALLAHQIYLVTRSAKIIKENSDADLPDGMVVALLTIAYFISLPLIQAKINIVDSSADSMT